MPYESEAQARLMRARAHGWKPKGKQRKKLPSKAVAKKFVKDSEGSRGGPLRRAAGGSVRPGTALSGRPLPRPGASDNGGRGGFGSSGIVGALGSPLTARRPLGAKPMPVGGPLSGFPVSGALPTSNVRPRPGRGVNPRLALAATPSYEAADRLERLRGLIR